MPLEVEAKLGVPSHEPVRARLRSMGAEPTGDVMEWNYIYDRPDGSLRGAGMGLRVRAVTAVESGELRATLTVKGPVIGGAFKSREEQEVDIDDADTMVRMLEMVGFVPILRYQKRRERWTLCDCRIELDEPPIIGLFVEIEGPGERAIRRVQRELGLGEMAHIRSSYVRMLLEHCQTHGVTDRTLCL